MLKRMSLAVGIALGLTSGHAIACGEFFGTSILENRQIALTTLWDASFALEAARLIPPPAQLSWTNLTDAKGEVISPDAQSAHLRERLLSAKQQADYARVLVEGAVASASSLPKPLTQYALGAHHYAATQWREALAHFQAASEGSATRENPWPLMAAYMVGRSQMHLAQNDQAVTAFDAVRTRSRQGEADPLSLGAQSLSEAATAHQRAGQWVDAIRLQMAQAALNVPGADVSLKWRIEAALRKDDSLAAVLADPVARDAVILYALAHLPTHGNDYWTLARHGLSWDDYNHLSDAERTALPQDLTSEQFMAAIERALKGVKPGEVRGADRLAALLYRQGQYDAARPFAEAASTPLSQWVQAKLALRRGDRDDARELYGKAMAAFPLAEDWGSEVHDSSYAARIPACRVKAEAAVLSLHRGDAVESLELFLRAGAVYWHDAAYLAERVLSIDELAGLVDRLAHIDIAPSLRANEDMGSLDDLELNARRGELVDNPRAAMANLLARRLMRAERYDEAVSRFANPTTRKKAEQYRDLLTQATKQSGTQRAKTMFEAATMARYEGINLLAFESSPDWAMHRGQYARPSNLEKIAGYVFPEDEESFWTPGEDKAWIADTERQRVSRNNAQSTPRFTYRLTAAELANRAADDLPRDSQAFGAVLCHATRWLLAREPELARKFYRRYREEADRTPQITDFGESCKNPEWPST
jgi:hypothetical protein